MNIRTAYDNISSSILLVLLSLIPSNNVRYMVLGLGVSVAVLYAGHLKRPSMRIHHLAGTVSDTENNIKKAKSMCPRDHISLTEESVCLLKVRRSMCNIRCALLQMPRLGWTLNIEHYWQLARDIYQCEKEMKRIQTAVQLIVEAECKRKYTNYIDETQAIVANRFTEASAGLVLSMYHQAGNVPHFRPQASSI
ncbi:hypothetical protein C8R44DRAFT_984551 [Mycena epipterygia]|nr:hypothetical protein C8R44DRAFT_984551 [Mycena epipterygia]